MLNVSEWLLSPDGPAGFMNYQIRAHIESGNIIHHTEYLIYKVQKRYGLINITENISQAIDRSKVKDGLCFISSMHITAGIYINDAELGLLEDIALWIEKIAPHGLRYHHHRTGEDNGDAHLKSYLTGHGVTTPVTDGVLDFGTWQQIFYSEFDGLREKRIIVKIMGHT